jgi:septal ring factor EnvC (AmiA/AmiB activator)
MADLDDKLDKFEEAKDALAQKKFTVLGFSFNWTGLVVAGGILSSALGALYAGFLMYQKVEEIASLDLGAYAAQMEQTSNKIETQERLLESIEQNLRDAKQLTYDIEKRVNDKIIRFEDKMDKFEAKVEDTKAELEDKLQKALDNPLSGN